eukprot:s186_g5.t1
MWARKLWEKGQFTSDDTNDSCWHRMKLTVAIATCFATAMALKQQRVTSPEEVPVEAAWGHRSVVSTVHGLTLLLALAAISTMALGLGMFYYQVVSDAEALLKTRTRKFVDSNAEGAYSARNEAQSAFSALLCVILQRHRLRCDLWRGLIGPFAGQVQGEAEGLREQRAHSTAHHFGGSMRRPTEPRRR